MAKVQFNCRLEEDIAEWIATEAASQTAQRGVKFSQADVISLLVDEVVNEREVAAYTPAIEEKIKTNVTPRTNQMREKGDKTR